MGNVFKNPIAMALITFVLCVAIMLGVDFVMDTFVRHQPFHLDWLSIALPVILGVAEYFTVKKKIEK